MRVDICHIRSGGKSFSVASLFMSKTNFCVRTCIYYKERYDDGYGLFYLEIGRFIEKRNRIGVKIKFLGHERVWYKKEVSYG